MLKLLDILKESEKTDHLNVQLKARLMEPNEVSVLPVVLSYRTRDGGDLNIDFVGDFAITPEIKSKIYAKVDYIQSLNLRKDKSFAVLVHEFNLNQNLDKIEFYSVADKKETRHNIQMNRAKLYLTEYNDPNSEDFVDRADSVYVVIRGDKLITFMFGRLIKANTKFFDVNYYIPNVEMLNNPMYRSKI